jgi:DNA-binding NarL/FixJ family response regulator
MIEDTESDWPQRILDSMWRLGKTEHDVSPAELAALNAISHGLTAGMAAELLIKERETVKSQLKAVRLKLKAKNTTHAACIAIRKGLIK